MQKSSFRWYALVVLLIGAALVAINVRVVWSTSVDLAHHYALLFRLSEHSSLLPHDPSLGEMNIYPRGSHLIAAAVGKLVGSLFLGMHLVALTAMVLVWTSCLAILYAAPNRTGPFNAIVLALVVVLNFGAFRIHGSEISNNYYFAQLVAQAIAFVAIAVAVRLDAKGLRMPMYALLLVTLWLVTSVHLLPAVELLATLAGLLALDVVFTPAAPRARVGRTLAACAVLGVGTALVVLNPAFAAMQSIASFNAGISLGPLAPLWSVGVFCVIALPCSFSLLRAWHRDPAGYVMYKYLGVYGAAVSSLCLLQIVLSSLHLGSDYAAKKYAFAVTTFLFMRLALWLGNKLALRAAAEPRFARYDKHPAFAVQVFGVALFVTVSGAARMHHDLDTRDVVKLEQALHQLPATALAPPAAGRQNLVLDLPGMPSMINYMFSLAVTHTSREAAAVAFPGGAADNPHLPLAQYSDILTVAGNARFAGAGRCAAVQGGGLAVVDIVCMDGAKVAAQAHQAVAP